MKTVVYSCPFVPPEWIAAHGLRPSRIVPGRSGGTTEALGIGVCPYARAYLNAVCSNAIGATDTAAAVFTTVCDQMRRAAEVAAPRLPTFLMHVPATWQTPQAHRFYGEELKRLGRFLESLEGAKPFVEHLADVMLDFDAKRQRLLDARSVLSPRAFSEAAINIREYEAVEAIRRNNAAASTEAARLAVVGGPLPREDYALFDLIEAGGGAVVLDATENGERTFPTRFDRRRVRDDPFNELVDAYFGHIPDAFRRPNSALYVWLKHEIEARDVQGIVLRRYIWCDTWHAEIQRMTEWAPVPLLALDVEDGFAVNARTRSRIEAFLEALR